MRDYKKEVNGKMVDYDGKQSLTAQIAGCCRGSEGKRGKAVTLSDAAIYSADGRKLLEVSDVVAINGKYLLENGNAELIEMERPPNEDATYVFRMNMDIEKDQGPVLARRSPGSPYFAF